MNDIERFTSKYENKRFREHQNKHDVKDKELLRLNSELEDIMDAKRNLGKIKIEPYHYGYTKKLIIKDNFSTNKLAINLYKKVHNKAWCAKKSFLIKDWKTKKESLLNVYSKKLSFREYSKLSDELKSCFFVIYNRYGIAVYSLYPKYENMFTSKVKKFFITHKFIIDPKLESRQKEIHNYLEKNNLWNRLDKLLNGKARYYDDWYLDRAKLKERDFDKETQRYLNFINEDKS